MLTVEADHDKHTPVTKAEVDSLLKTQLSKLHMQIKKDVRTEMMQIVSKEGGMMKSMEEVLSKTIETAMNKTPPPEVVPMPESPKPRKTKKIARNRRSIIAHPLVKVKELMRSRSSLSMPMEEIRSRTCSTSMPASVTEVDVEGNNAEKMVPGVESEGQAYPLMTPRSQSRDLQTKGFNSWIEKLVLSQSFEYGIALMVILNVILIGVETQIQSSTVGPWCAAAILRALDVFFCVVFTAELALRVCVYREQAWFNDYLFESTAFDTVMVAVQITDQIMHAWSLVNVHALSVLRILRIARIIRLLHLFDELSALISGMTNSVRTMLWTVVLLAILMYMFSIIIMQVLLTTGDMHSSDALDRWFGTVYRASCTLFEILLGGLEWSEILEVLTNEVSLLMGFVMSGYIVISFFFMMNLVCGVFVDRVTKTVREDKDEKMANRLSEIFTGGTGDGTEQQVTWPDFAAKLTSDDIRTYFTSIDVNPDVANARGLFELIDVDCSGCLSGTEIVEGCLRLRGPAKALEVALLSADVAQVSRQGAEAISMIEKANEEIKRLSQILKRVYSLILRGDGDDDDLGSYRSWRVSTED